MTSLLDEFTELVAALDREKIDYAVCGGWAMAIHGLPRATLDIDLMVLSEDLPKVWEVANAQGYDVEGLPMSFDQGTIEIRRISKIDAESKRLFTLDFLLVTDALKQVWLDRIKTVWNKGDFWVVSREGLICLKKISGRKQDLLDVEKLLEAENEG